MFYHIECTHLVWCEYSHTLLPTACKQQLAAGKFSSDVTCKPDWNKEQRNDAEVYFPLRHAFSAFRYSRQKNSLWSLTSQYDFERPEK